ncbi:alpha/beta fold hydrolase [Jannaschia formosa]|uniref:alpha/beta fold hydrolase n=1 Tax=Jannaschia formosa TaxID=2259592 RepID=UPI000E1BAD61|nr:alpha/beta hydrolase [Jannaschia formosa]TFL16551.1 alpha/beta hydrolase [Jannaschia formosa]
MTTLSQIQHVREPLRLRRFGYLLASVAAIAVAGGAAQEIHRRTTQIALSVEESLVDIGGRDLRLVCSGAGDRKYILEAGATGFAETWTWVQDALDDDARVCSYDRAGMGLSDPSPDGFDPARVATDLHAALTVSGEDGPYILVGHSLGGFLIRDFAAQYPQDVEALVFVDSSHEDQLSIMPEDAAEMTRNFPNTLRMLSHLSATGLLNLWNPIAAGAEGLEGEALRAAEAFAGDRVHLAASADEMEHWDDISARVRQQERPRDLPVLAVTAGASVKGQPDFAEAFSTLHVALAEGSDQGRHIVMSAANHFSILTDREQGAELARLIATFAGVAID